MMGVSPAPDFREIKVGMLLKRSQFKSGLTRENYKTRLFVLDTGALRYFDGTEKDRGDEKGVILLSEMRVVEQVENGLLSGQKHVFQISYTYERDQPFITLYVVAPTEVARDSWITAIRTEALKQDASLQEYYHRGVLVDAVYNCCGRKAGMEGCQKASQHAVAPDYNRTPSGLSTASLSSAHAMRLSTLLMDSMLKRSQGRSAFFTTTNYRQRTFVLDANSLRYYDGDLRIRKNERCRIHLSCVVAVEPSELEKSEGFRNAFQVVYFDEYELLRLYVIANSPQRQQAWIKAIKKEAVKHGAEFLPSYHPGLWLKKQGRWDCCEDINSLSEGCRRIVALPEMKLCGADLNVSNTASMRAKSPVPVKVALMLKKSQNKSTFFTSIKYQERVFTLDNYALAFYSGYLEDQGKLKGSIPFVEMLVVEPVKDGMLDDKINVFQVIYHEDANIWNLYIVSSSEQERISWITAIKKECARSSVALQHRYHPGVWVKQRRCYNCCHRNHREAQGCTEVTDMSLVSIRDRTNTMDSLAGYRQRLGTLDSVPEHAIAPSPARPVGSGPHTNINGSSLNHGQQLKVPEQLPSLRPRYLRKADGVPIVPHPEHLKVSVEQAQQDKTIPNSHREHSQESLKPPLPRKKRPELNQREKSNTDEKSISDGNWSKGVAELTMASVGVISVDQQARTGSSSTATRVASNTRPPHTANSSMGNSRQTSSLGLDSSAQYSEDFESVSELDL